MNQSVDSADWKAMYMRLFPGITDALELLPVQLDNAPACEALSRALRDAEEQYISGQSKRLLAQAFCSRSIQHEGAIAPSYSPCETERNSPN